MRQGFTLIELMIVIAIIAIIAAIAIPNLLESRVTANESAAGSSLKTGIFVAQVQFQAGGYQDLDADNVGEYGTLTMLSGINSTNKVASGQLRLLTGPLASTSNWVALGANATGTTPGLGRSSGYMFSSLAPSESNVGTTITMLTDSTAACPVVLATASDSAYNGTKYWLAWCAPGRWGSDGRRLFVIGADGQIRSPAANTTVAGCYNLTNTTGPAASTPYGTAVAATVAGFFLNTTGTTASVVTLTSFDAGIMNVSSFQSYTR